MTNVFNESVEQDLHEEIGSYKDVDGFGIMTDARHGWRKNAKDTSVIVIGEKTHKVLQCVHIQNKIIMCHRDMKQKEQREFINILQTRLYL